MSKITMYSGDNCGDCVRSKRLLDSFGIAYTEINASRDEFAAQKVRDINGGYQSIPVIVFSDGTHLTEPSDNQLKAKLEALAII